MIIILIVPLFKIHSSTYIRKCTIPKHKLNMLSKTIWFYITNNYIRIPVVDSSKKIGKKLAAVNITIPGAHASTQAIYKHVEEDEYSAILSWNVL